MKSLNFLLTILNIACCTSLLASCQQQTIPSSQNKSSANEVRPNSKPPQKETNQKSPIDFQSDEILQRDFQAHKTKFSELVDRCQKMKQLQEYKNNIFKEKFKTCSFDIE